MICIILYLYTKSQKYNSLSDAFCRWLRYHKSAIPPLFIWL